ncbi:MAG TPA: GNAT family N-acetyltransferase [Ktedonobacteraceae bacterium]|nr:GNAT family N-acetyltransferase [Ktedonobacteraceae bacterium]
MSSIAVRPARAEDRDIVLEFCANTWDWGDYIADVWDDWLNDSNGALLVATVDGRPAAISHLLMVSDVDVWFEGLRVDPQFRRQGLAKALNDAAIAESIKRGAKYARLAIDTRNTRSIQITEYSGLYMRRVGSFTLFSAQPLPEAPGKKAIRETTQLATLEDMDQIIDYLNASNILPLTGGLYYINFKAMPITTELLEEKIAQQHIYLLRRWERLDGLAIAEVSKDHRGEYLSLGYIDGTVVESVSLIAHDLRLRLPDIGAERVRAYAPDLLLVRDAFIGTEYKWENASFYTYEQKLA